MYHVILYSSGNLVESFDNEPEAHATLEQIVGEAPEAAEHLALVTYDEHGEPVGDAITFSTHAATR